MAYRLKWPTDMSQLYAHQQNKSVGTLALSLKLRLVRLEQVLEQDSYTLAQTPWCPLNEIWHEVPSQVSVKPLEFAGTVTTTVCHFIQLEQSRFFDPSDQTRTSQVAFKSSLERFLKNFVMEIWPYSAFTNAADFRSKSDFEGRSRINFDPFIAQSNSLLSCS